MLPSANQKSQLLNPTAEAGQLAARPPVAQGKTATRVLLAEDNKVNQRVLELYLKELGFDVDVVDDGFAAVKASLKPEYSLILMDCSMPLLDGFDATRAIRKNEFGNGRHIPIVAITAHAVHGDRERCLESGMDDYIAKPVTAEKLREALNRWAPKVIDAPVDLSVLQENLDPEVARDVLDAFIKSAPALLAELERGIMHQDDRIVHRSLVELSSSCTMLGAISVLEVCLQMDELVDANNWKQLPESLTALFRAMRTTAEFVKKLSKNA